MSAAPANSKSPPSTDCRKVIGSNALAVGGSSLLLAAWPFVAAEGLITISQSGMLTALGMTATVLAVLPAGVVADRADRVSTLRVQACVQAAMIALALVFILALHWPPLPVLAMIAVGCGLASSVVSPTVAGLIKQTTSPERLPEARASLQVATRSAQTVSAPLAGVLAALWWPLSMCGALLSMVVQVAVLSRVSRPASERGPQSGPVNSESVLKSLTNGIKFTVSSPMLRSFAAFASFGNFASVLVLVTVNLTLVERGTPVAAIGLIDGLAVCATVCGGLLSRFVLHRFTPWQLCLASTLWTLVALVPLIWQTPVWLLAGCLVLSRLPQPAAAASVGGYVMHTIPDQYQGRAAATISVVALCLQPLAPVVAAFAVTHHMFNASLLTTCLALMLSVFGLLVSPTFRQVGKPKSWQATPR